MTEEYVNISICFILSGSENVTHVQKNYQKLQFLKKALETETIN